MGQNNTCLVCAKSLFGPCVTNIVKCIPPAFRLSIWTYRPYISDPILTHFWSYMTHFNLFGTHFWLSDLFLTHDPVLIIWTHFWLFGYIADSILINWIHPFLTHFWLFGPISKSFPLIAWFTTPTPIFTPWIQSQDMSVVCCIVCNVVQLIWSRMLAGWVWDAGVNANPRADNFSIGSHSWLLVFLARYSPVYSSFFPFPSSV